MRITSPKNIPLQNSEVNKFSRQSNTQQKTNDLAINTRQAFHSHQNSIHSASLAEQYNLGNNGSQSNDTYISNGSGRSRSNHHGISMTRDKTIKLDNIYQPEHFGKNKHPQNYSTKSITTTNRNTKSISRLTRATSPTTTTYPERRQSQYTLSDNKTSFRVSNKELSQSYGKDAFDFKDLNKEINKANHHENTNILVLPKNQDYFGRSTQLTENRQFLTKHKQPKSHQDSTYTSDYNFQQKSLHRIGSKSKGLRPSMAQKEPSITSQHSLKQYGNLEESREKSPSSFFSICTNAKSHKLINSSRDTPTMKPYSPSSNSKLGWRDVIKK